MSKEMTSKRHYKMYKKGRFWVFAGILAFGWQIAEGTTVHADEAVVSEDNSQAVVAPAEVDSDKKSVTLTAGSENDGDTPAAEKVDITKNDSVATGQEKTTSNPAVDGNNQERDAAGKSLSDSNGTVGQTPTPQDNPVGGSAAANQPDKTENPSTEADPATMPSTHNRSNLARMAATPTPEVTSTIKGVNGTVNWSFDSTTGAMTLGGGTIGSVDFTYTDANDTVQTVSREEIKSMAVTDELYITGDNGVDKIHRVGLFSWLPNGVTGLDKVDVSQATDLRDFFVETNLSQTVDLNGWDVRKVTNMDDLFNKATGVTDIELNDWKTNSLTSMDETFSWMDQVITINVADWDTSHVTTMTEAFRTNSKLANLDVSKWNVSQVDSFYQTFYATPDLKIIDVSKWNVSNATEMGEMFLDSGVQKLDLSGWDVSNVRSMASIMGEMQVSKVFDLRELKVSSTFRFPQVSPGWYGDIGHIKNYPYTGNWIDVSTGKVLTPQELNELYQNSTGGPAATYIAQIDDSDRSKLTGQDIKIYQNMDLDLTAGVRSLQDYRGEDSQPASNQLSYTGNVDVAKIGQYPIQLIYTSGLGNKYSVPINVNVIARKSLAELSGQDEEVVLGPSAEDNEAAASSKMQLMVSGVGNDGRQVLNGANLGTEVKLISATYLDGSPVDDVDFMVPNVLKFVFGYLTSDGIMLTQTSLLTLAKTKAAINLKEPTIVAGPTAKLNLSDYFDSLDDALGNQTTDASAMTFTGVDQVDLTKLGDYTIEAAYTDSANNPITATTTVHVIKNTATLELTTPAPLIAGPATKFDPTSVIKTAVTATGDEMTTANGLKIDNQVDPQKVGTYTVTVSYQDNSGNQLTKSITVNVVPTQLALTVEPTVKVTAGQSYDPTASVLTALDAFGQNVSAEQLTYTGTVNTAVPGVYQVQVTNQDAFGNTVTKAITVMVTAAPISSSKPTPQVPAATETKASADTLVKTGNKTSANIEVAKAQGLPTTKLELTQLQTKPEAVKQSKKTTLPQTDSKRSALLTITGLVLLMATTFMGLSNKRRRD